GRIAGGTSAPGPAPRPARLRLDRTTALALSDRLPHRPRRAAPRGSGRLDPTRPGAGGRLDALPRSAGPRPRHVPGALAGAGGEAMSGARAAILARIAAARRTAQLPPPPTAKPLDTAPRSLAECLARFRSELAALGVECHVEASAAAVRSRVQACTEGGLVL